MVVEVEDVILVTVFDEVDGFDWSVTEILEGDGYGWRGSFGEFGGLVG